MKKNSVLIIDWVGQKAGMDYYDSCLASALNACNVRTYVASNYKKEPFTYQCFNSFKKTSKAGKLIDLFTGTLKACIWGKRKEVAYVLLHIFSTEKKDLLSVGLAKLFGFKLIVIAHDVSGFAKTDSRWIKHLIFNHWASKIIVHNQFSAQAIRPFLTSPNYSKLHIIPHGSYVQLTNGGTQTRELARQTLGISSSQNVILFFGQIKKVKGLDILLDALPSINESVLLLLAGKPWKDDFTAYEEQIIQLDLQTRTKLFIRYIEDAERELFFRAADLVVVPYRAIFQSGVLLMGMSYKVPVLASDLDANREVVAHGQTGLLFRTEDARDLAAKVNDFFSGVYNTELISQNAFNHLEKNHCWQKIASSYKTIL